MRDALLALAFLTGLLAAPAPAQSSTNAADLAPGKLLVATRSLRDPNFLETVVVLVTVDERDGVVGLILNRPEAITLGSLASESAPVKRTADPMFTGGPVSRSGVIALLRTAEKPRDGKEVGAQVYFTASQEAIHSSLKKGAGPEAFRAYLGYSGWGPGQLERELKSGAWFIQDGSVPLYFDPKPETLWGRLIARADLRFAGLSYWLAQSKAPRN